MLWLGDVRAPALALGLLLLGVCDGSAGDTYDETFAMTLANSTADDGDFGNGGNYTEFTDNRVESFSGNFKSENSTVASPSGNSSRSSIGFNSEGFTLRPFDENNTDPFSDNSIGTVENSTSGRYIDNSMISESSTEIKSEITLRPFSENGTGPFSDNFIGSSENSTLSPHTEPSISESSVGISSEQFTLRPPRDNNTESLSDNSIGSSENSTVESSGKSPMATSDNYTRPFSEHSIGSLGENSTNEAYNKSRMVLVIGGVSQEEPPPDSRTLFLAHPVYRESGAHLVSIPTKVVGPMGLLYVQQREMAVTVPHDKNVNIIGTDDVTTCIIAILRHTGSGAVGLAHLDGSGIEEGVLNMVHRVQELALAGYPEGRYELSLIGGVSDSHNYSEELFYNLMHAFHKQVIEIDLVLACIGELNTIVRNGVHWPILYGAGVNVKTGEIFPATFTDKGPEQALRSARHLTGGQQVLDIYDCSLGLLRIGPFNYNPLRGVDLWLEQPDEVILQHLSTTPDVEPPHFVMQIRQTLKYIQDNPFPAVTVFRDNRPHYYRRDEHSGAWAPFRY